MAAKKWAKFPHGGSAYVYEGAALKKSWGRLHRGDCEPLPEDAILIAPGLALASAISSLIVRTGMEG